MVKFKNTLQRMAILDYLKDNKSHPSAEDIYLSVKEKTSHVSLATVYNTLDVLKKNGLISELSVNSKKRRYDPNTSSHHHFICLVCNDIIDINEPMSVNISGQIGSTFEILSYEVDLYGYCNKCRKNRD